MHLLSELSDGYEPHDHIPSAVVSGPAQRVAGGVGEGCTRGMGTGGWLGGAIPVPTQYHSRDPYLAYSRL